MKSVQKVMTPEELRKMQLIQVDILTEFDRVCRENNITYILDAGTMLGAARHKGFLPWDDDIDIRMLRSEYDRFSEIADKELGNGVYFQTYKNDKYYPWLYSKLRMSGTRAVRVGQENIPMKDGVWVDIFPCDGVPSNAKEFRKRSRAALICRKILYARVARDSAGKLSQRLFWKCVCLIPKSVAYRVAENLSRKYNETNCTKVGSLGWHAAKDTNGFDIKWFQELTDVEFEGKMCMAPKDWDGFLRHSFGDDYMTPPPTSMQKASSPLSYYDLGK
jgi:lipopolysaccharide cholinephosphotransferase